MSKTASEPLKKVRSAKALMRCSELLCLLLLAAGGLFFWRKQFHEGWVMVGLAAVFLLILALPAHKMYRAQWKRQHVSAGFGQYAEQVELDESPHMLPEQFELLCLFPCDIHAMQDFTVRREVRLVCRERLVRIAEMTVPARIRGLEAMVDGCLIQMDMPRAPMTRLMLTGMAFGEQETLIAWYRKNLRLLPALFSVQQRMRAFGDGSESDLRTLNQLRRITEQRPQNIVLSLAGRELNVFIRNASLLTDAPIGPARITEERLRQLAVPELSAILDFAFDTEALRAGADVPFDDEEDRKQAGIRYTRPEVDADYRRPETRP